MSVRKFNREFESISNDIITAEDEAHLHCILGEVLISMRNTDLNESSEEVPTLISNLHHVVLKVDTKSGIFWKSMEILDKIIETFQNKTETSTKLRLLPLLTDALTRSNSKIDYFLRMIEEITFGIAIKLSEPFLERLIKYIIRIIIIADKAEHDLKVRTIALSALINLCYNNFASLSILNGEINIVDLQKKVSIDNYGFLSCKLILVLNDCGHLLRDTDIRNYLKSTSNELQRIPSLDPHLLRHLVEFLKDIAKRPNTKEVFRKFDFHSGIMAAMMILDNTTEESSSAKQSDALFQIIQIVLKAENSSLKKLLITILNFAMKKLNSVESHVEAIETITCIFNYDTKMSTSSFEFEEMQSSVKKFLECHNQNSYILISIFKLLSVLAKCFRINLLSPNLVNIILSNVLVNEDFEYFKMNKTDITMYLQCISTLAVLNQYNLFSMKTNIFQKSNVQQLIGMAIKHGDAEQCNLALMVVGNTPTDSIAKIISCGTSTEAIIEPEIQTSCKQFQGKADSNPKVSQERIDELFKKIESAYADNIFDSNSTSEVIDLYSNQISWLKRRNEMLTNKANELSKEITQKDRDLHRLDIVSTKWEEHWKNAEKSIQILMKEKTKLESMAANLSDKLKSEQVSNAAYASKLATEQRKTAELEKKLDSMEDELKDVEEMRLTVLNMMTKRKKGANKENVS